MTDNQLKQLAEYIILGQTEDIEFMSVWEIMDDQLQDDENYVQMTDDEQHQLALKIDKLISRAKVTVTFE